MCARVCVYACVCVCVCVCVCGCVCGCVSSFSQIRGLWLLAGSLVLSAVLLVATPYMPAKWDPRLRRLLSFISHTTFGVVATMAPHSVWLPVGDTDARTTVPFTLILLAMSPIVTIVEAIVSMLAILAVWGAQHYAGADSPLFTLLMAFVMGCGCAAAKIQLYFALRDDASRRTARVRRRGSGAMLMCLACLGP